MFELFAMCVGFVCVGSGLSFALTGVLDARRSVEMQETCEQLQVVVR